MTWKSKLLAACAFFLPILLPAAASAETIGVSMSQFDDNFLTVLRDAMTKHAATLPGVSLQMEDAQNDIGKQLNQIQNFVAEKVDAIIVNPVDTDATPKMTALAEKAGIPLVYVNRLPADKQLPPKVAFVGSDEHQSGTLEMEATCKLMGGKGNILVLMGELSNQAARQRTQDVKDVIAKPNCNGIKILDAQAGNWSRTKASDLVTNWLSAGLNPDAIVSNNDEMAIGAIQSLKQSGKMTKVIVAGVDATADGLATMKAGDLKVTVFQNAAGQGTGAVDTAVKLAKGQKLANPYVYVPFQLVTPANLNTFLGKN
jgi:inositol transport system substrate-binding protein